MPHQFGHLYGFHPIPCGQFVWAGVEGVNTHIRRVTADGKVEGALATDNLRLITADEVGQLLGGN